VQLQDRDETIRLLLEASRQDRLSGLQDMLRVIAQSAGAFGAVMWEVAPGSDPVAKKGRLFVLGSWFEDSDVKVWYYLTLGESLTGETIRGGVPRFSPVIQDERLDPNRAKKAMQDFGITTSFNVPLELHQFKAKAAINLYWKSSISLSPDQEKEIASHCSLVPDLYAALVDHVGLDLLHNLNRTLRQKAYSAKSASTTERQQAVQRALNEVVLLISRVFNCRETCIFLENRLVKADVFELYASDWNWPGAPIKTQYTRGKDLTGYVLESKRAVRILDLALYQEDYQAISESYPGIEWQDRNDLKSAARVILDYQPDDDVPPISFMAVPIISDGRILGAIRCCSARTAPNFFDDRQVAALGLAAESVAAWWENWLDRWQTDRENEDWANVIEKMGQLNGLVRSELTQRQPSESKIFKATMEVLSNLISDTPACDIRLKRADRLYIAETFGALWEKGGRMEVANRKNREFPLAPDARPSAAAHVFRTKKPYVIESPGNDLYYDPTFPEVRKVMLSPLVSGKEVYGTLGIQRTTDVPFAEHEKVLVSLLANQLGLYHFLAEEIKKLNRIERELHSTVISQRRMYEDFQHQIRSPITQASLGIRELVDSLPSHHVMIERLLAVQALCAQAERVARNLDLFVSLALDKPIKMSPRTLSAKLLIHTLKSAARDHQVVIAGYRDIRFHVDEASFSVLGGILTQADPRLLEQAINNLFDNAGKYSYSNTTIKISAGLMDSQHKFFISVTNEGLPIRGDETKKVMEREYRADAARKVADGHGIGLWIVSKVMEVHGGSLMVIPTTDQNVTDVRLVFPRVTA